MYKRILIATDGSPLAMEAIKHGLDLTRAVGAEAHAVMVTSPDTGLAIAGPLDIFAPPGAESAIDDHARRRLDVVAKSAARFNIPCKTHHVKRAPAHEGILDTARDEGCDLIVMASHGQSGLQSLVLGSVAQKVLTLSTVPVLVCR